MREYRNLAPNLDEEKRFLKDVSVVVSDVPSFPLFAAREAGTPSVLIANFTWVGIYREFPNPPAALLERMTAEYRSASLVLRSPMYLPLDELGETPMIDIPHVVRPSKNIRAELLAHFKIPPDKALAFLSVGQWGLPFDFSKLSTYKHIAFFAFDSTPGEGFYKLSPNDWSSQDILASVDVVISKAGYGTVAECLAGGTPLIFPPRTGFAEQPALEQGLAEWGGGIKVSESKFFALDIESALEQALAMRDLPIPDMNGGMVAAKKIMEFL